jgi:glutamyl-tRNA synthetase
MLSKNKLEKIPAGHEIVEGLDEKIIKIVPLVKERIKTLSECDKLISPFFVEVEYDAEIKNHFKDKKAFAAEVLNKTLDSLANISKDKSNFNSNTIEHNLRQLSDQLNVSFRKIAEVVRIAIWGTTISPPLFKTMEIIGKEEAIKRLESYKDILAARL